MNMCSFCYGLGDFRSLKNEFVFNQTILHNRNTREEHGRDPSNECFLTFRKQFTPLEIVIDYRHLFQEPTFQVETHSKGMIP